LRDVLDRAAAVIRTLDAQLHASRLQELSHAN
jgi:hypothetical protein